MCHVDARKGKGKGEKRKLGDITMHEEQDGEEAAAGSGGAAAASAADTQSYLIVHTEPTLRRTTLRKSGKEGRFEYSAIRMIRTKHA
jgi:hypothetical protein